VFVVTQGYGGPLVVTQGYAAGIAPPPPPAPPTAGGEWVAYDRGTEWVAGDPGTEWAVRDAGTEWVTMSSDSVPAALKIKAGGSRSFSVNLTQWKELRAGELLTGTPTVAVSPSGPVVSGPAVSGNRVRFRVTVASNVAPGTDGGNTLAGDVELRVH
jgi:hypothetical protein